MDVLRLRLKRLGLDKMLMKHKMESLQPFYFEVEHSKSQEYFIVIATWLLNLLKKEVSQDKPLDAIATHLRSRKININASILKKGYGPEIVSVLDQLAISLIQTPNMTPLPVPNITQLTIDDVQYIQQDNCTQFKPLESLFATTTFTPEESASLPLSIGVEYDSIHQYYEFMAHYDHFKHLSNKLEPCLKKLDNEINDLLSKVEKREQHASQALFTTVFLIDID